MPVNIVGNILTKVCPHWHVLGEGISRKEIVIDCNATQASQKRQRGWQRTLENVVIQVE